MGGLLLDPMLDPSGPWGSAATSDIAAGPPGYQLPASSAPLTVPIIPDPSEARRSLPIEHTETVDYEGGGIFPVTVSGPPEGGRVEPQSQPPQIYAPPVQYQPRPQPLPYPPDGMIPMPPTGGPLQQAVGSFPDEHSHMLGLSVIGAAGGAVLGYRYGGSYGSISGAVLAGAVINAYRAVRFMRDGTPEGSKEAMISGTYAIGALALGSVIWWKLAAKGAGGSAGRYKENRCRRNSASCRIRPVGP